MRVIRLVVAAMFVAIAAGCGGADAKEIVVIGGETEGDWEKGGFAFEGDEVATPGPTIRVLAGDPVRITFENVHGTFSAESIPHDFAVVAEKNVPVSIQAPLDPAQVLWGAEVALYPETLAPRQRESVTFTPDVAGSFYYICSVPGHVDRGMWGRFVVEE